MTRDGWRGSPVDGLLLREMRHDDVRAVSRVELDRHADDPWSSTLFHDAVDLVPQRYVCDVVVAPGGDAADLLAYGIVSLAGDSADLDNLTVRRDHERRGIARWLLTELVDAATERGAAEMLLEVRQGNDPAIALYRSAGFTAVSERRHYYGPGVHAVVMRRDLLGAGLEPERSRA